MRKRLLERLREKRGESLVESLASMLIITLAGLLLAGAIISAARVNERTQRVVTLPPAEAGAWKDTEVKCKLSGGFLDQEIELSATKHTLEKEGMAYYEKAD